MSTSPHLPPVSVGGDKNGSSQDTPIPLSRLDNIGAINELVKKYGGNTVLGGDISEQPPTLDALAELRVKLSKLGGTNKPIAAEQTQSNNNPVVETPVGIPAFRADIEKINGGNTPETLPPENVTMILSPQIPDFPPGDGSQTMFIPPFSLETNVSTGGSSIDDVNGLPKSVPDEEPKLAGNTERVMKALGEFLSQKEKILSEMIRIKTFSEQLIAFAKVHDGNVLYNGAWVRFNGLLFNEETVELYVSLTYENSKSSSFILYSKKNKEQHYYFLVDGIDVDFGINLHDM